MSNKISDMIVNVQSKKTLMFDKVLRDELLAWINSTLQSKFNKIEELCTGAAYCQLLHTIFPTSISIKRVKFITNLEHECFENFKILQKAFDKLGVKKSVPVTRLCKGKYQENLEFLVWFRKFYMANDNVRNRFYDPMATRNGMPMKYGPVEVRRIYEKRAAEAMKATLSLQHTKISFSQREFDRPSERKSSAITTPRLRTSSHSLKRSATKTIMKHRRSSMESVKDKKSEASSTNKTVASAANSHNSSANNEHNCNEAGSEASNNSSIKLKRSATRTVIKANKIMDDIESVQFPSPVSSEDSEVIRQKATTENEIVKLRNKLLDVERSLEQKTRTAFELELELTKTQNEINEMQLNLRRARQERDNYFDKIRKVTMCCRNAQCNAELSIPVSEVMKIFLADSNLM